VTGPIVLKHRPLTVEAWQVHPGNEADIATWAGGVVLPGRGVGIYTDTGDFAHAEHGGWIIRGPFGDYYPAPDRAVFAKFERVVPAVGE
jgi:hypothetical protein